MKYRRGLEKTFSAMDKAIAEAKKQGDEALQKTMKVIRLQIKELQGK